MGPSGLQGIDVVLWVGLAAVCLVITAVALWQRAAQRPARARELTREQRSRLRDEKELVHALEDLLARVDEVSRRVGADLEARQHSLQALIDKADQRIGRLRSLTGKPHTAAGGQEAGGPPSEAAALGQASGSSPLDERQKRIFELTATNATPATIADAVQIPVGEVELLLNLRRFAEG